MCSVAGYSVNDKSPLADLDTLLSTPAGPGLSHVRMALARYVHSYGSPLSELGWVFVSVRDTKPPASGGSRGRRGTHLSVFTGDCSYRGEYKSYKLNSPRCFCRSQVTFIVIVEQRRTKTLFPLRPSTEISGLLRVYLYAASIGLGSTREKRSGMPSLVRIPLRLETSA